MRSTHVRTPEAANHDEDQKNVKRLDKLFDKIEKISESKIAELTSSKNPVTGRCFPNWMMESAKLRTTPYTEAELDTLTEGTIGSIEDLAVWKNLVAMVGLQDATRTIRMDLQEQQLVTDKFGLGSPFNRC